jgi:uncharacterized protein YeaO (DUF488 family)
MAISVKRVYDPPAENDGYRVLVDRMWPRGLRKDEAQIDLWLKDVAPSTSLRQWFNHDPGKWREFKTRYFRELKQREDQVDELKKRSRAKRLTLLYAAKDTENNNAVALKEYLETR